jgi:hypothetical protein
MAQEYVEVKIEADYGLDDPMPLTAFLKATFGNSILGVGVHGKDNHVLQVYLQPDTSKDVQARVSDALSAFSLVPSDDGASDVPTLDTLAIKLGELEKRIQALESK